MHTDPLDEAVTGSVAARRGGLSLADVVRWVIVTLVKMAQTKAWGEVRITVQGGQIEFVHHHESFRDRLPVPTNPDADRAVQAALAKAS